MRTPVAVTPDLSAIAGVLVAVLGGAAVGLERQWSGHASGARPHFGGIRTFTLLGSIAGLSGWLLTGPLRPLAIILLAAAAALIVAGYVAASRADVDATTEVAGVVVLGAGTIAGAGYLVLASALIAATAMLLVEKTRLHALVSRIDDASLRASARFAAMALVVLPLLPVGPYGPYGAVRPRELWALVLFFSGLSFLGWIARRMVGSHRGAIVSGLLGGVISSTSVTLQFARDSRTRNGEPLPLAAGAIGASTVMLLRVAVACAVLNPALARGLPEYLAIPFVFGAAAVLAAWRIGVRKDGASPGDDGTPLQLGAALQMTALFQVVLFAILAVQSRYGATALVATSAFVGLTDLDALTFSLARSAGEVGPATLALVAGVISNTLLKFAVTVTIGRGRYRMLAGLGLGAQAALMLGALLLLPD